MTQTRATPYSFHERLRTADWKSAQTKTSMPASCARNLKQRRPNMKAHRVTANLLCKFLASDAF
ncbi:MAG: hypothetical protein DMF68_14205 [Acidobacteria bacterium]|nr:MAG: hypothetical protein DMF68_14205 [Acidobacteriota bacterium]